MWFVCYQLADIVEGIEGDLIGNSVVELPTAKQIIYMDFPNPV